MDDNFFKQVVLASRAPAVAATLADVCGNLMTHPLPEALQHSILPVFMLGSYLLWGAADIKLMAADNPVRQTIRKVGEALHLLTPCKA
jgi:hypothetical protein